MSHIPPASLFVRLLIRHQYLSLILCSQISVQVCWSHLLWGGGSALKLGQWPDSLLIHTVFCTGPLFWFWWPGEGKKMSCAPCSAGHGQAHTQTMRMDLSSVLYSVPPLTLTGAAQNCHVRPDVPALHQGQWLPQGLVQFASLGRWERQNRSPASAEDIPLQEQLPLHCNLSFSPASAKAPAFLGLQEE